MNRNYTVCTLCLGEVKKLLNGPMQCSECFETDPPTEDMSAYEWEQAIAAAENGPPKNLLEAIQNAQVEAEKVSPEERPQIYLKHIRDRLAQDFGVAYLNKEAAWVLWDRIFTIPENRKKGA